MLLMVVTLALTIRLMMGTLHRDNNVKFIQEFVPLTGRYGTIFQYLNFILSYQFITSIRKTQCCIYNGKVVEGGRVCESQGLTINQLHTATTVVGDFF